MIFSLLVSLSVYGEQEKTVSVFNGKLNSDMLLTSEKSEVSIAGKNPVLDWNPSPYSSLEFRFRTQAEPASIYSVKSLRFEVKGDGKNSFAIKPWIKNTETGFRSVYYGDAWRFPNIIERNTRNIALAKGDARWHEFTVTLGPPSSDADLVFENPEESVFNSVGFILWADAVGENGQRMSSCHTGANVACGRVQFRKIELVTRAVPLQQTYRESMRTQTFLVDMREQGRAVSPLIFGINDFQNELAHDANASRLPFPLRRWGGNHTSRYNWKEDVTNRSSDYFFLNIPFFRSSSGSSRLDDFVVSTVQQKATPLITVPMIGWVAKDRTPAWSFSKKKLGPQRQCESSVSKGDACDGYVRKEGQWVPLTEGWLPSDTSIPASADFISSMVEHLKTLVGKNATDRGSGASQKGTAALSSPARAQDTKTSSQVSESGVQRLYALDNEPDLWDETHRDLRAVTAEGKSAGPAQHLGSAELWERTVTYATAIRKADPQALITGPVASGWCAYFGSARDRTDGDKNCKSGPDARTARHGKDILAWYLQNSCKNSRGGRPLVDVLDLHYYPHGGGGNWSAESSSAREARFAALRSLYDPDFVDNQDGISWISEPVELIPRMKKLLAQNCPQMKLLLSEWRFGANPEGISSVLANAEALAIFAREGVDMATFWGKVPTGSLLEQAFRLFLDYDGKGGNLLNSAVVQVRSKGSPAQEEKHSFPPTAYAFRSRNQKSENTFVLVFNKSSYKYRVTLELVGGAASARKGEIFELHNGSFLKAIEPAQIENGKLSLNTNPLSVALIKI